MSNREQAMTIGAVAALTGRRPSSIRYYEQIGLLPPARRVNGRRVYGPDTVRTRRPATGTPSSGSATWPLGSCRRSPR